MRIFVGNLPFSCDDETLHSHFAAIGEVSSARVMSDRETGRSRGFGFVEMADADQARSAIEQLDGQEIDGRRISVSEARPPQNSGGGGGNRGGGGGRGGHGGGRGHGGGGGGGWR